VLFLLRLLAINMMGFLLSSNINWVSEQGLFLNFAFYYRVNQMSLFHPGWFSHGHVH